MKMQEKKIIALPKEIKIVAYKRNFDDRVLLVAENIVLPEGINIDEKCSPGVFVHPNFEPEYQFLLISDDFYNSANKTVIGYSYEYVGGKENVINQFETMITAWEQENLEYNIKRI